MDIKILVAAHKEYQMPDGDIYLPVHVGKAGKTGFGFTGDDTGENISEKNKYYSELTGLYWAWKNLKSDYIGLAHYRRHFTLAKKLPNTEKEKFDYALKRNETERVLSKADIILPKLRKYYIENLFDHYKHTMHIEPLIEAGEIISERYPKYSAEYENLHHRTSAHMFNMFVMKREIMDEYCEWLFDILYELERRFPPEQYDAFHARYPGRISELLLDIWLRTKGLTYEEIRVMDMQPVNWRKKGSAFLKAKFIGKKYEGSF